MVRIARGVLASAVSIGALTAVVHGVTLVKELVVAYRFGTSDALDAFLIAYLLPSVVSVFLAGSFASCFMPMFIQVRERAGSEAANRFYEGAFALLAGTLGIASMLCLAVLPPALPWIVASFPAAKRELAVALSWIVIPTLFTSGIATIWTTLLNASHRFAAGAIAPILVPASMALFVSVSPESDPYALAWGALTGSTLQMAFLGWLARRDGFDLFPRWHGLSAEIRETLGQYGPMILGALLMSATGIVDQVMAARLHGGDLAALGYAGKVIALVAAVGAMAMGTALMPLFSGQLARNDVEGLRKTALESSRTLLFATTLAALAIILFSDLLIRLLFERGAFGESDRMLVSWIQQLGAIQIPFYALAILLARLLSSLKRNDVLCVAAGLSLVLKVVLNILLIPGLGVAGIALATSLMYAFTFSFLLVRTMGILRERTRTIGEA